MKPPEDCSSIEEIRRAIDALDREIVRLIGRRAGYVRAASWFKTGEAGVRAPERQRAMLEARRRWAKEEGLSPEVIEQVYKQLLYYFVNRELADWRAGD